MLAEPQDDSLEDYLLKRKYLSNKTSYVTKLTNLKNQINQNNDLLVKVLASCIERSDGKPLSRALDQIGVEYPLQLVFGEMIFDATVDTKNGQLNASEVILEDIKDFQNKLRALPIKLRTEGYSNEACYNREGKTVDLGRGEGVRERVKVLLQRSQLWTDSPQDSLIDIEEVLDLIFMFAFSFTIQFTHVISTFVSRIYHTEEEKNLQTELQNEINALFPKRDLESFTKEFCIESLDSRTLLKSTIKECMRMSPQCSTLKLR